ncbi:phosphorylated adapter RNA export protein [Bacillus rossius redtenbacheri]|uniref:phosphorylated adapter RNA export protein n=1 Tax=Bacillus rossius redtenbacheri TaxID=93214 RepID=UPI002FDE6C77
MDDIVEEDDSFLDSLDYNPIPRPSAVNVQTADQLKYIDNSEDESCLPDSDSDDSDSPTYGSKRSKVKKSEASAKAPAVVSQDVQARPKKRNNIWCMNVQESSLVDELESCGMKSFERDMGVESYFVQRSKEDGELSDGNGAVDDGPKAESERLCDKPRAAGSKHRVTHNANKRRHGSKPDIKQRLGSRRATEPSPSQRHSRTILDLATDASSTDEEMALDIANKLSEPKDDLILRIVTILGKEKAVEYFKKTQEIEADGGMLIKNNSRRRTPGGVYLFLVKLDTDIPPEKQKEVFLYERHTEVAKKRESARKRRAKAEELRRTLSAENMLPNLSSHADLAVQLASKKRAAELDGEAAVSNPPPSPVTDGRDNSSDELEPGEPDASEPTAVANKWQLQEQDDCLDIGCDMDVV